MQRLSFILVERWKSVTGQDKNHRIRGKTKVQYVELILVIIFTPFCVEYQWKTIMLHLLNNRHQEQRYPFHCKKQHREIFTKKSPKSSVSTPDIPNSVVRFNLVLVLLFPNFRNHDACMIHHSPHRLQMAAYAFQNGYQHTCSDARAVTQLHGAGTMD